MKFTSGLYAICLTKDRAVLRDGAGAVHRRLAGDNVVGWAAGAGTTRHATVVARPFQISALKVGVIEQIEEVHAEFQVIALMNLPVLGQLHVDVAGIGAGTRSATGCTDRADLITNKGERVRIEELIAVCPGVAIDTGCIRPLIVAEPCSC